MKRKKAQKIGTISACTCGWNTCNQTVWHSGMPKSFVQITLDWMKRWFK